MLHQMPLPALAFTAWVARFLCPVQYGQVSCLFLVRCYIVSLSTCPQSSLHHTFLVLYRGHFGRLQRSIALVVPLGGEVWGTTVATSSNPAGPSGCSVGTADVAEQAIADRQLPGVATLAAPPHAAVRYGRHVGRGQALAQVDCPLRRQLVMRRCHVVGAHHEQAPRVHWASRIPVRTILHRLLPRVALLAPTPYLLDARMA